MKMCVPSAAVNWNDPPVLLGLRPQVAGVDNDPDSGLVQKVSGADPPGGILVTPKCTRCGRFMAYIRSFERPGVIGNARTIREFHCKHEWVTMVTERVQK